MKSHFAIISTLILASCGPNQQEKEEIAIIACNIMGESRNMDSAMRIREVNSAREEIGEKRFLGTDDAIKEAFEYDLCKELVLNDSKYNLKLIDAIEAEFKEVAALEKKLEEIEKEAEMQRIEEERIKSENYQISAEKFKGKLKDYLDREEYTITLANFEKSIYYEYEGTQEFSFTFNCIPGLFGKFDFEFESLPKLKKGSLSTPTIICDSNSGSDTGRIEFRGPDSDYAEYGLEDFQKVRAMRAEDFEKSIVSVSAVITGIFISENEMASTRRKISERTGINLSEFTFRYPAHSQLSSIQEHSVSPIILPVNIR